MEIGDEVTSMSPYMLIHTRLLMNLENMVTTSSESAEMLETNMATYMEVERGG